jgi:hypothetical protein
MLQRILPMNDQCRGATGRQEQNSLLWAGTMVNAISCALIWRVSHALSSPNHQSNSDEKCSQGNEDLQCTKNSYYIMCAARVHY